MVNSIKRAGINRRLTQILTALNKQGLETYLVFAKKLAKKEKAIS